MARGPSIFKNIRTGPVHGPSPDEPRTGTGPDFKALDAISAIDGTHIVCLPSERGVQLHTTGRELSHGLQF